MDAITISDVTKTYRLGVGRARVREMTPPPLDRLAQRMFPGWWSRNTFNALDGVSFSVPQGASVGLIGHNGAGKTTLLKTTMGITSPTKGSVRTAGRVAAIIDVLVGFHPDLTGRENAYLLGAVYGFSRRDMSRRLNKIIEFAEIEEFADTPLKRFSTGMTARLGFSIVASLDMNVLLIDEVLAVGDASFQRKCINWMGEFRARGGTLLFVSHNLALIRGMTERVVWLDHGRLVGDGATGGMLTRYAKAMEQRDTQSGTGHLKAAHRAMRKQGAHRWGIGGAYVDHVHFAEPSTAKDGWKVRITYQSEVDESAIFCLGLIDEGGKNIGGATSPHFGLRKPEGSVQCTLQGVRLSPGVYFPVVALLKPDGVVRDRWRLERPLVIDSNGHLPIEEMGPIQLSAAWSEVE